MVDIIIIGAGPAGLTAAIYALRAGKKVLIFESTCYGGKIIQAKNVENYPGIKSISGTELANCMYEQVKDLNVEIIYEKVINILDGNPKKVVTLNKTYESKSVIIATGLQNRTLKLDKETSLIGKGVSYCATCDGMFFKDKTVAVIGGGNSAVYDALYLTDLCKKVYLIYRKDKFKSEAIALNKLKEKENIEFILNSNITKLNGENALESIEIKNNLDETKTLNVDGLFIAIGQTSNVKSIFDKLELDEFGYIITDEFCKTNIDGIYAAGDIRKKAVRQLTTATSDGTIAALMAIKNTEV